MVLDQLLTPLGWFANGLWRRSGDAFDVSNGLFGSIVAVTGDAHQAQVAQDIFRQEVRIERSVRIREDIRDAHKLMIENVQTQLLMGSIILGICFAVLIEGRPTQPDKAPEVVQELWAVFAVWSVSLSLLSVWFALQFQQEVSVSARRRLLDKHRVFTPNDDVVGRMGGLSLAEKVAHLHQNFLNELAACLASSTGSEGAVSSLLKRAVLLAQDSVQLTAGALEEPAADDLPRRITSEGVGSDGSGQRASADGSWAEASAASPPQQPAWLGRLEQRRHGRRRGGLETSARLDVKVMRKGQWEEAAFRQPIAVCVGRGERAWLDEGAGALAATCIVDLPDFLLDETLVRCSWSMPARPSRRRLVHFKVRGTATLYVAAQWPPLKSSEAFRGQGPPPGWKDSELPTLQCGGEARARSPFRRVEGFSILVSEKKMDLPVYRAELPRPDSSGWCEARLQFRFPGEFEAPILILRQGAIPADVCEEDWPVMEFMSELTDIQPLREHSMHYMSHGLLNLLLAAFFAHLGRVLTDRPWPQCRREVALVTCALLPAFLLSLSPDRVMQHMLRVHIPRHQITGGRRAGAAGAAAPPAGALEEEGPVAAASATAAGGGGGGAAAEGADAALSPPPSSPLAGAAAPPAFLPRIDSRSSGNSEDFLCCLPALGGVAPAPRALRLPAPEAHAGDGGAAAAPAELACWAAGTCAGAAEGAPPEPPGPRGPLAPHPGPQVCAEARPAECLIPVHTSESSASPPSQSPLAREARSGGSKEACACLRSLSKLQVFRGAVRLLWASSILWILVAWDVGEGGGRAGGAAGPRAGASAWALRELSQPLPLFAPTAAAFTPDGLLWIASDWSLLAVNYSGVGSAAVRRFRLPVASKGLIVPSNYTGWLFVADGSSLHRLDVANTSLHQNDPGTAGLKGMMTDAVLHSAERPIELPAQLGPATAVAGASLPAAARPGGPADVVALAAGGGACLCAAAELAPGAGEPGPARLEPAARLPPPAAPGGEPARALHLCAACGAEAVLWAVAGACLTATDLASSRALGAWPWPAPGAPAALTGNSSHLLAVAATPRGLLLFAATYEALLAAGPEARACSP